MRPFIACVTLAVTTSACDSTATIPTVPAPAIVFTPAPTPAAPLGVPNTLSGVVYEVAPTGRVPVQNVEVYCDSCGSEVGHTFAYTDAEGAYKFEWTYDGTHRLLVTKAGYRVLNPTVMSNGWEARDAIVKGDTRFDIEMVRR